VKIYDSASTMTQYRANSDLKKALRNAVAAALLPLSAFTAASAQDIKFHDETNDTTRITSILIDEARQKDPGNVIRIAELFIGTPYAGGTLEGDEMETLRVNLSEMDCTTFVETVLAMAYTAAEHRQSWHDFVYNLRRFRYRHGETDGYASRLHYASDWIVDNTTRGNLREITGDAPNVRYGVKSLYYMTENRKNYPALADSINFAAMKNVEAGFSNHRYPYIKGSSAKNKMLAQLVRDGDVILFTTSTKGLDVTHMGIIKMENGIPMMIHASSKEGKVVIDKLSIENYIARHRNEGVRIVRLVTE